MKKLSRSFEPICLKTLKSSSPTVWNLSELDKEMIWKSLNIMQSNFCAYCEGKLIEKECHIEHLIPQNILKTIRGRSIYEWDNLFGSCDNSEHCGRYKDHIVKDYDSKNLIKPDLDDGSNYLSFLQSGSVVAQNNLNNSYETKARETIRILNLDCSRLKNLRAKKIGEFQMQYLNLEEIKESMDLRNKEDQAFYEAEMKDFIESITNSEYYTAVRQNTIG